MPTAKIEVIGVLECEAKQAGALIDKVSAFFADLDNHIATVKGSIKVNHAQPRLQPTGGKSSKRKSKGAAAHGG